MFRHAIVQRPLPRSVARVASLITLAALLAGCASIPQRAWRNGEAMSNSRAYQRMLAGDHSFSNYRQLQTIENFGALGHYREAAPFAPFPKTGSWY